MIEIRRGQAPALLARAEFSVRFRASFIDPEFRAEDQSIARVEEIAWQAYVDGRKAPLTQKAGPGYVDPSYDLSVEWIATKQRIGEARLRSADPAGPVQGAADMRTTADRSHWPGPCESLPRSR
jgi:hypothetical protein